MPQPIVQLDPPGHNDPTPAPAAAAQPAAPKHPSFLVNMAKTFGMSDEQIAGRNTDALEAYVQGRQEQINQHMTAFERLAAQPRAAHPEPAPQPKKDEDDWDFGEIEENGQKVKIALDAVDPFYRPILKRMLDELKTLKKGQGELTQFATKVHTSHVDDVLDAAFDQVAAKHPGFYGDGSMAELVESQDAEAIERRRKLLKAAGVDLRNLPSARKLAKQLLTTIDEFKKLAGTGDERPPAKPSQPASNYFPESEPAPQPAGRAKDPRTGKFLSAAEADARQAWENGALATPSNRLKPEPKNGVSKAERSVRAMMDQWAAEQGPEEQNGAFVP